MRHFICIAMLSAFALQGDTLYLRDGRSVSGTFLSGNRTEIRFRADAARTEVFPRSRVDRISFDDNTINRNNAGVLSPDPDTGRRATGTRARTASRNVPEGTVVTVRLIDPVDSDHADAGQTYRASLDEPITDNGVVVAPAGADATVKVVSVDQSGTISGREEIALVLSEVLVNGRRLIPETQHAEVSAKSRTQESAKVIGGTAVVGAIIGAIAGGGKGAAIGAASGAGAGAAIQAIRGQRIQIPSETKLDFTLTEPLRY